MMSLALWACAAPAFLPGTGSLRATTTSSAFETDWVDGGWRLEDGWLLGDQDVIPDVTGDGLEDALGRLAHPVEPARLLIVPSPLLESKVLPRDGYRLDNGDVFATWSDTVVGDATGDGLPDLLLSRAPLTWLFPGPITGPRELPDVTVLRDEAAYADVDGDEVIDEVLAAGPVGEVRFGPEPYDAEPDVQIALCPEGGTTARGAISVVVVDDVTADNFPELWVEGRLDDPCGGFLVSLTDEPAEDPFATGAFAAWTSAPVLVPLPDENGDGLPEVFRGLDGGAGVILESPIAFEDGELVAAGAEAWSMDQVVPQSFDTSGDLVPDLVVRTEAMFGPGQSGYALVDRPDDIPEPQRRWSNGATSGIVQDGHAWILWGVQVLDLGPAKVVHAR